jgi:hypothetical protein
MPRTITYANQHGLKIGDVINDLEDDFSNTDSSYVASESNDESLLSDSDNESTEDSKFDSVDNDDGDDLPQPRQPDGVGIVNHDLRGDEAHSDQDNHDDDNDQDDDNPPCGDVVEDE